MSKLEELQKSILADGVIDDAEVEALRKELFADGQIDRDEVTLLVNLRNKATKAAPSFEKLFFDALKQNLLADGKLEADEAAWVRSALFADGKIDDGEKQFLRDLKAAASAVSPEFQALFDECMKS